MVSERMFADTGKHRHDYEVAKRLLAEDFAPSRSTLDSHEVTVMSDEQRLDAILVFIGQSGDTDGAHHKQWALDQIVRIATKCKNDGLGNYIKSAEYHEWIRFHADGEDGPNTHEWDEGLTP